MPAVRIALASLGDPSSVKTWSGTPSFMLSGFTGHGVEVVPIGVSTSLERPLHIAARLRSLPSRKVHVYARSPLLLRGMGRRFADDLRRAGRLDLIVTVGSFPVPIPEQAPPVIVWTDATVEIMSGYNPEWSNWSSRTVRQFLDAERRALSRADLFIAASDWAAKGARRSAGLSEDQMVVVPFGANMPEIPRGPDRKLTAPLRLLSVGNSWHNKGMETAVAAVDQLNRSGCRAQLDIVGCDSPPDFPLPDFVTCHGFVSKSTEAGRRRLDDLYRRAHLFILATRFECYGVVFCEAAAYGLPVVAPYTGGVPTAVHDQETGVLVREHSAEAFAAAVKRIVDDPGLYSGMSRRARKRYEAELNWGQATGRVLEIATERGLLE